MLVCLVGKANNSNNHLLNSNQTHKLILRNIKFSLAQHKQYNKGAAQAIQQNRKPYWYEILGVSYNVSWEDGDKAWKKLLPKLRGNDKALAILNNAHDELRKKYGKQAQ